MSNDIVQQLRPKFETEVKAAINGDQQAAQALLRDLMPLSHEQRKALFWGNKTDSMTGLDKNGVATKTYSSGSTKTYSAVEFSDNAWLGKGSKSVFIDF